MCSSEMINTKSQQKNYRIKLWLLIKSQGYKILFLEKNLKIATCIVDLHYWNWNFTISSLIPLKY